MAHFVKLDENNVVIESIVVHNNDAPDEQSGIDFLHSIGFDGIWKQTSYNTRMGEHILGGTPFRYNYAGIGFIYLEDDDVFISPSPYPSWILNKDNYTWQPPIPKPDSGAWVWDEDSKQWVEDSNY